MELPVTNIGQNNMILGLPWLKENNPRIDWRTGQIELTRQQTMKEQITAIAQQEYKRLKIGNLGRNLLQLWPP